jgi:hypothetical protein
MDKYIYIYRPLYNTCNNIQRRVAQSERVQSENHPSRQRDSRIPERPREFLEATTTIAHCLHKRKDPDENGIRYIV